jgi:hypothetical protein
MPLYFRSNRLLFSFQKLVDVNSLVRSWDITRTSTSIAHCKCTQPKVIRVLGDMLSPKNSGDSAPGSSKFNSGRQPTVPQQNPKETCGLFYRKGKVKILHLKQAGANQKMRLARSSHYMHRRGTGINSFNNLLGLCWHVKLGIVFEFKLVNIICSCCHQY